MEELKELGSAQPQGRAGMIHCLTIVGQVEGHQILPEDNKTTKYEHVMPLLAAVEESEEIKGLLILLNTVGGDVEAGLGIAEIIAGDEKAHGFARARRRTLDRRAACRCRVAQLHCAVGGNDYPSGAPERRCHRRSADV